MFYIYKKQNKSTMSSSGVCMLPLEVGDDEVDDVPHAFSSRGLRLRHRTVNHRG